MAEEAGGARRIREWGPVCDGFRVALPSGERGVVQEIRRGGAAVELIVATGLFARRRLSVGEDEIEAILPAARRIVVSGSNAAVGVDEATADAETAGGIVRMPVRHSASFEREPREAA